MISNDPKVIAKLLRAMARDSRNIAKRNEVIFNAAADLLDPPRDVYVKYASCSHWGIFPGDCLNYRYD